MTRRLAGIGRKDFEKQEVAPERAAAVFLQVAPSESVRDDDDRRGNGKQQLLKETVD